jgi:SAM-dependent methyltransferase
MSAGFDPHADSYRAAVQKSIDFIGQSHDFFTESKADWLLWLLRRHVGDPAGVTALDVGCGVGETDTYLAPVLAELHGVDISGESIALAAERNARVHYRTYDGRVLPYDDATFDLVFAISVVHHVPPEQWDAFAGELARVTAPGGIVTLIEHNPWNPLTRLAVSRCEFDDDAELLRCGHSCRLLAGASLLPVEQRFITFFPWRSRKLRSLERGLGRVPAGAQYLVAARKPAAGRR